MKVVILAGGFGTRLSEETSLRPKPMIELLGKPILWHIMKIYSYYGFNDFIICLGYKGYIIKEYFYHYFLHETDITIDLKNNKLEYHNTNSESWKVTLVDTGLNTLTGSRIKRVQKYIGNETFMMTYGDGVSDININNLLNFHKQHGKYATMIAVRPMGRFGALKIENDLVIDFKEKPVEDGNWINGGFFVLESEIFNYIDNDNNISWEKEPLERLAQDNQLNAFKQFNFWKPMDTLRDKNELEKYIKDNTAPWMVWDRNKTD